VNNEVTIHDVAVHLTTTPAQRAQQAAFVAAHYMACRRCGLPMLVATQCPRCGAWCR
jgi:hypothetical protein